MQLTKCQLDSFYGNDTVSSFQQKNQDGINNPANTHEIAIEHSTKRLRGGLSLAGFVARPASNVTAGFPRCGLVHRPSIPSTWKSFYLGCFIAFPFRDSIHS
jgi:hypothetical protein